MSLCDDIIYLRFDIDAFFNEWVLYKMCSGFKHADTLNVLYVRLEIILAVSPIGMIMHILTLMHSAITHALFIVSELSYQNVTSLDHI